MKSLISVLALAIMVTGCLQSEYTKLVKEELATGVRKDSVVFDIELGDSRDEFYAKCTELNKQQLIMQGSGAFSVQHFFKDSLVHSKPREIKLLFSPIFDKGDTLAGMDLDYSYSDWAPWNKSAQSDSLEVYLIRLLELKFKGNPFIEVKSQNVPLKVKVDGNRRMVIVKKNEQIVSVKVQDLLHPNFMHSISKNQP
ncbi:MAG: hypothetical protein ACO3FI_11600 [Cyclobacteriaceae bacterium]